jgi:hypothetical protein
VSGSLESNHEVIRQLAAINFAPAGRKQVLQARCCGLSELVGAWHENIQAFVRDLSVVGHGRTA